jgi:hypothetical protein
MGRLNMHLGAGLWMNALPSSVIVLVTDRVWLSEWQVLLCTYVFTYLAYSFILWHLTELSVDPIM